MTGLIGHLDTTLRRPTTVLHMDRRRKKGKKGASHLTPSSSAQGTLSNSEERHTDDVITISTAGECMEASITPERAGIIIYTIYHKQLYIGLAVDSASHDLTDFGGRIYYDNDFDCITGSLREFHEESLGLFDPITSEQVKGYTTVYDSHNLIMFLHLDVKPNDVSQRFLAIHNEQVTQRGGNTHRRLEVCGITWLTITAFINSVAKYGTIYERVRKVLLQVPDWHEIF